jgi:outer membrane lipoprotein SlyB
LKKQSDAIKKNTDLLDKNSKSQDNQKRSIGGIIDSNKMFAASMATSLIQGFLPAVDENSGALLKLSHAVLNLVTTIASVGFALEMFGAKLNTFTIIGFLNGKGMGFGNVKSLMGGLKTAGLSPEFSRSIVSATQGFAKLLGPLALTVTALYALHKATDLLVDSIFGSAKKAKEAAIQKGDINEAGRQARIESNRQTYGAGLFGGAAVGAVIGTLLGGPGFGTAIGTAIGGLISTFSTTYANEAENVAKALAANTKTTKALEKAQTDAAIAAEKFAKGTISASDYLNVFSDSFASAKEQSQFTDNTVKQSIEGKSVIGNGASGFYI